MSISNKVSIGLKEFWEQDFKRIDYTVIDTRAYAHVEIIFIVEYYFHAKQMMRLGTWRNGKKAVFEAPLAEIIAEEKRIRYFFRIY